MKLNEIKQVTNFINLANNGLTDLRTVKHMWSRTLQANLDVHHNQLHSLQGLPVNITGSLNCSYNQLITLKYVPESIGKNFICSHNHIETVDDFPKYIGFDCDCSYNQIKSLANITNNLHTLKGKLILTGNPIQEKISTLTRVHGLEQVIYSGPNQRAIIAFNELNKRLIHNRHLHEDYQQQEEFAKWLNQQNLKEFI